MLTIVFAHTGELYPMGDASHINPLTFFMFAYRESLMAAFYIASGYGFRKRSIGKCIDQQFKTLLKPYIYTGIATTVYHFIIHYSPTPLLMPGSSSFPPAPCGICSR